MSLLKWNIIVVLFFVSQSKGNDSRNSKDFWSDASSAVANFLTQWSSNGGSSGSYQQSAPSYQQNYRPQAQGSYYNHYYPYYQNRPYYGGGSGRARICSCDTINRYKRDIVDDSDPDEYDEGQLNARIVGGVKASQSEYPEPVLVLLDGSQHCGGTMLNEKYVMTAAHCIAKHSDATKFSVIPGLYDMGDLSSVNKYKVIRGIYHPDYNQQTYDNDIALLELEKSVDFRRARVKPTCIPTKSHNLDGIDATAVGWGKTSESGSAAQVLQKVVVPVVSNKDCKSWINERYAITDNMICAGYEEGGKDACGGDSGGPLFIRSNNQRLQVGITSFGEGCARAKRPGVYTRIDKETDFLTQNMPNLMGSCAIYSIDATSYY